jgi:membrane-associated phospholipid phosphatase
MVSLRSLHLGFWRASLALLAMPLVLAGQGSPPPATEQVVDSGVVRPSPAFGWPELRGFALTAALAGVASLADQSMRDATRAPGPQNNDVVHVAAEYGDLFGQPVSLSLAWVMYGGGLYAKRPVLARTGFRAVEAITVSGVVTWTLKQVFGRARPEVSPNDPGDWEWGRGFGKVDGDFLSMPSGHTTAAFAFATAVTRNVAREAPQHARWVGAVTYASAAGTAYARIYKDRHWLSDVVAGAGVGTVTALAIDRWHATRPNDPIDRFFLKPVLTPLRDGSTGVGLSLQFR